MTILCTFPGKYGDLLWALPTIRAISRRIGAQVDLRIGAMFGSILPLLEMQDYLGSVRIHQEWTTEETAPISPRLPPSDPGGYDAILHLGYREWPTPDCVRHTLETYNRANNSWDTPGVLSVPGRLTEEDLQLQDPWITLPPDLAQRPDKVGVVYGFTEEHFELKAGLIGLLDRRWGYQLIRTASLCVGPRWRNEANHRGASWITGAQWLTCTRTFLGDCSAWHVLAVAMGVPVVLMEPAEARWNPVFYPLGDAGPQVVLVRGVDGKPTWDARHVAETVERHLDVRRVS